MPGVEHKDYDELTLLEVALRLHRVGVQTLFIEPGSPRENGYVESFDWKLRDERLDRELLLHSGRCRCSWNAGGDTRTRCGPCAEVTVDLV
jgi:hypothetical protein